MRERGRLPSTDPPSSWGSTTRSTQKRTYTKEDVASTREWRVNKRMARQQENGASTREWRVNKRMTRDEWGEMGMWQVACDMWEVRQVGSVTNVSCDKWEVRQKGSVTYERVVTNRNYATWEKKSELQ